MVIPQPPWWQQAFSAEYLDVYAHRGDEHASQEVAGLLPRLRQSHGLVLDACCGNGRHLAALRESGIPAYGFDLSPALIQVAGMRQQVRGRIARCDMRHPAFANGWSAVLLLFTAFGYFDDPDNQECLKTLSALLRPGGWLVVDLPEQDHLARNLVATSQRATPQGLRIFETRRIIGNRIEKEVRLEKEQCLVRQYQESVRLYSPDEIHALARLAALEVVEVWPSLQSAHQDEHRCVYWLRRL